MKANSIIKQLLILLVLFSCKKELEYNSVLDASSKEVTTINLVAQDWPGTDPKPYDMPVLKGLDHLTFNDSSELSLKENDLVLGIEIEDESIAIPLTYLEGFEVANFKINEHSYLVTWCPLVGSSKLFKDQSETNNAGFDFGFALVNNNLLMVDRQTQTVWNQLSNKAIHGKRKGETLQLEPSIQTTWQFWKDKHPDTKVLINTDTTNAVFPSEVLKEPFYTKWQPSDGRYFDSGKHDINNLGLGIEIADASVYFPLNTLFKNQSPIEYTLANTTITIHFNTEGLTAWATNSKGELIPTTLAYNWAWKNFYPETTLFSSEKKHSHD
ncbi:MAG: hypothetical protein Wins2KO_03150 [Winogradskyella sp.]